MPIKIVSQSYLSNLELETAESTATDAQPTEVVTYNQIIGLSNNFFARVEIKDQNNNNQLRFIDATRDTKTIYFQKSELDALFKDNDGSDGLLIYLGVHDSTIYMNRDPAHYDCKIMTILATMTGNVVNLKQGNSVDMAGSVSGAGSGGGNGMDNGTLCPPDTTCKPTLFAAP